MAQEPILNQVTNLKARINRMLAVSRLAPSGSQPVHGRPALLQRLPVRSRYRTAARAMRILDRSRLGSIQPEKFTQASQAINTKFSGIRSLLHLSPNGIGDTSFWSPIDTALAGQSAPAESVRGESNIMRQGTVINRFDMFPKPGQSISDFKEQSRATPSRPRPGSAAQKPSVKAGSRLYSRVEEVPRPGAGPLDQPVDLAGATPSREPQAARPESAPERHSPQPKTPTPDLSTRARTQKVPADEPDLTVQPQAAPAAPKSPQARANVRSQVVSRADLPLAKPGKLRTASPDLPQAKPARTASPSTSGPVVQRQVARPSVPQPLRSQVRPASSSEPRFAPPRPSPMPQAQPVNPAPPVQIPSQVGTPDQSALNIDSPLAEHIEERVETSRQLPLATPKQPVRSVQRLLVSPPTLVAARGLQHRSLDPTEPASTGRVNQERPLTTQPESRGLVLPLARTSATPPQQTSAPQNTPTATHQTLTPPVRQQPGQGERQTPQQPSPVTPQVQRDIDIPNMDAPSDPTQPIQQLVQGPSAQADSASSQKKLDQLAEEIYPLVKRLIEIENDRTSAS